MARELIFNMLLLIFLIFLVNPYFLFSHAHSPKSNAQNSSPLVFLRSLIGTLKGHKAKGLLELKKHLSHLGYMKSGNDSNIFDANLELVLKRYQKFFSLKQNGILDHETIESLLKPRCGMPDLVIQNESQFPSEIPRMTAHYTFLPLEPKWPPGKTTLAYSFPPGTRNDVMQPIKDATAQWAKVTHFKFKLIENYDRADIKISFQYREHGDGSPFDGPGGVLAHDFGPNDGRLHYDADEKWINGVVAGDYDLETIGLHELGHVLGLGHSTDGGSITFPSIGPGIRKGIGQDDINGIRALYHN